MLYYTIQGVGHPREYPYEHSGPDRNRAGYGHHKCAQGSGISTGDPYGTEIYLIQVVESLYNDLDEQIMTSIILD